MSQAHPPSDGRVPGSRRFLVWSLATALVGVLTYCAADEKPLLAVLSVVAAGVSAWMTLGRANGTVRTLPRIGVNLLVLAAMVYAALEVMSQRNPLVSNLSDFLVLVLLTKFLDRRRARDEAHMLGLSIFVVIGSVLTSNSFLLGLVLAAYTPMMIVAVVWYQVYAGRQQMTQCTPQPVGVRDGWGRAGRRSLAGLVAVSLVAVLGLGLTAFVLTPRTIASQAFGQWGQATAGAQTDFRPDIELGQAGLLSTSEEAVMDVALADAQGVPVATPPALLYLRGAVLDEYDPQTGRWGSRNRARRGVRVPRDAITRAQQDLPANEVLPLMGGVRPPVTGTTRYTINIHRAGPGRWPMFAPWRPVSVSLPTGGRVSYTADLTLTREQGVSGRLTYVVAASPDTGAADLELVNPRPTIAGPEVTARVRAMAESILRDNDLPLDTELRAPGDNRLIAQTVATHLRTRYAYTLEMIAPPADQDPIEMFLFETRRGHCEYFAAGLTALLRSVGVDARVVTGYAAGEFNPLVGALVVRKSDAHAWVEACLQTDPARWETFDATPPSGLAHNQRAAGESMVAQIAARFRQAYEAAELRWIRSVVAFDQTSARVDLFAAGESARRRARDLSRVIDAVSERLLGREGRGARLEQRTVRRLATVGAVLVGVAGGVWLVVLVWRRIARALRGARGSGLRRAGAGRRRRAPAFYAKLVAALARAGYVKPPGVHARSFARRVEAEAGGRAAGLVDLVELYYAARFGGQALSRGQGREALARVRLLTRSLRRADNPRQRGNG
ncbi:MAG: DUF3488 and DUF4129 domain-containing transglutaminase family protein [Phycisphaerales bacterium]